jgi:hypothetical protein
VPSDRVVKQIKLTEELQHKLKLHALQQRKEVQEIADEAMERFLEQRERFKRERGRPPDYIASPTDATVYNVRLSKGIARKVDKVAKEDASTGRRFVYTGLIAYARQNKLIPE